MRFITFITIIISLGIIFSGKHLSAHHGARVLGDSTRASDLVFPPVTSGAGFILPDSPFFFLDRLFQQARLLTAFSAERKARVRLEIANERLAELRIMLARDNQDAVATSLSNLTQEVNQMSKSLTDAAAAGQDVSLLAKSLNETIKTQRKILGIVEDQTEGVLKLQFKTARKALKTAKIEIEDELAEDELENEIEEDINEEIEEEVEEASKSAKRLEHAIDVLTKLASEAAQKQKARREEALRHAIEVKNEALKKQEEKLFEQEMKKQKKLLEAHKKAVEEAREAIEKSQEAADRFKKAKNKVENIKKQSAEEVSQNQEDEDEDNSEKSESSGARGDNIGE